MYTKLVKKVCYKINKFHIFKIFIKLRTIENIKVKLAFAQLEHFYS